MLSVMPFIMRTAHLILLDLYITFCVPLSTSLLSLKYSFTNVLKGAI